MHHETQWRAGPAKGLAPGCMARAKARLQAAAMGLLLAAGGVFAAEPAAKSASAPAATTAAPRVRVAIVRTAQRSVREAMLFAGGRFDHPAQVAFSAFLVEHGDDRLLVDTGLGRGIDAQYQADMPLWMRPFFRYDAPVRPVRDQLDHAGLPPVRSIVLSHAHWDHASALADFPEAEVRVAAEELAVVRAGGRGSGHPWPSQVGSPTIRWSPLALADTPYEGFDRHLDLFGDDRVVVVAMPGHTPGSVGVFVRTGAGRRLFLVGDAVWNAGALGEPAGQEKFAPARWIVDGDAAQVRDVITRIRESQRRDPALIVVPAHDGDLQASLGLFPQWIE